MTKLKGRPKKFSLTLKEQYESIPDTLENREYRLRLLKLIIDQQKIEHKPKEKRKKPPLIPDIFVPQNPGTQAALKELYNKKEK